MAIKIDMLKSLSSDCLPFAKSRTTPSKSVHAVWLATCYAIHFVKQLHKKPKYWETGWRLPVMGNQLGWHLEGYSILGFSCSRSYAHYLRLFGVLQHKLYHNTQTPPSTHFHTLTCCRSNSVKELDVAEVTKRPSRFSPTPNLKLNKKCDSFIRDDKIVSFRLLTAVERRFYKRWVFAWLEIISEQED